MKAVKAWAVAALGLAGLAGCAITEADMQDAQAMCVPFGGVDYIPGQTGKTGSLKVICKNGLVVFKPQEVTITAEEANRE